MALAQDPNSGLLLCTDASTHRESAEGAVPEFIAPFRRNRPDVRYLAFDSRFTTYKHLDQLDRDGVLFVTERRRGKRLVERARALSAADPRLLYLRLTRGITCGLIRGQRFWILS